MGARRATIIDVAQHAGVSWKTVSRVMNREANVRPQTVAKVEAAIAALDFQPNNAARTLAGTRSFLLGAIADNPSAHYYMALNRGGALACRASGYHLALEEISLGATGMLEEFERNLRRVRFDGVFLSPPVTDHIPLLDLLDRYGVRYVRLAPAKQVDRSDSIFADDAVGVAALARHLWDLGHRRLGVVKGPPEHSASHVRLKSFLDEIERLGGDRSAVALAQGDFSSASGLIAGRILLNGTDRPTAVFASNDDMASGVVAAAGEAGLKVPAHLAVAGFDDSVVAGLVWPPLTTVRQPIEEFARIAVEMLLDPRKDEPVRRVVCPVELVIRRSTVAG